MRKINWTKTSTPLGTVYVAAREERVALVSYGPDEDGFLREVGALGVPVRNDRGLQNVVDQLAEYFDGRRTAFDIDVDLTDATPFQQSVLRVTQGIPYGMVRSYKEVAEAVGKPGAARAVGTALGNNPVGIIIPCHRVIASDGSIGGYSGAGGISTKRRLLELEGVCV